MNVAVVGLGFMGATHLKAWGSVDGVRVAAVVSSDPRKLAGDLTGVGGNLGMTTGHFEFGEARRYTRLEDALRDPLVDAVDLCLPSNLHAGSAIAAFRHGKDVFVEKPLALTAADAQHVVDAAEAARRVLMTGHVLRFIPAYQRLRRELRDAGRILSATFSRNCATPAWTDVNASGGPVLDLPIHDIDFCISLWGMPQVVTAQQLVYEGMPPVTIEGGWHDDPLYPFSMAYRVVTERGMIEWNSATATDPDHGEDPFVAELRAFTEHIRNGGPHPCPPQESVEAVQVAEQMMEARRCSTLA